MPRILLTNDDGAHAPGLLAAYHALEDLGEVIAVAPANQRSGASHTITLDTPLRARRLSSLPGYKVDFSPVDCVKLALKQLLEGPPDLVVSGINRGHNAGVLVHYSGTVAAAKEAALAGHQAMAISLCQHVDPDFTAAAKVARIVSERLLKDPLPPGVVLNVNVPPRPLEQLQGFRWCRLSKAPLDDQYERREDPRGLPYYWLTGAGPFLGQEPDDDLSLIREGYVTLTPLSLDWTHEAHFGQGPGALGDLDGALGR